jgi:predicted dehydrogenase
VVKQNRFNTPVQKLREALDEGRFGRLVMGTVRVRWCRRQDYYDQDAWRGTWRMDGGVFANQASHHVDLLQWLMGDVESVYAVGRRALADIETEDVGIATLRFAGGAVGVIEATTATRPADLEGSVSVLGESGSVEIGGFAVNRMLHWRFTPERPEDAPVMDEYRENPPNVYGFGHARYLQNVVDALVSGAPAAVDGVEGRRSLRLIAAIYASMERGREVRLDEADLGSRLGRG